MKLLLIICGVFLFLGIANLPLAYFAFLKIVVTISVIIVVIREHSKGISFWNVVLVLIAILYNPVIQFNFNDTGVWKIINLLSGVLFMVKASRYRKILMDD